MIEDIPPVHVIRLPGLHGPVHDWFVIPDWAHAEAHAEGIEHEHRPEPDQGDR
jgi:hypothetical protein